MSGALFNANTAAGTFIIVNHRKVIDNLNCFRRTVFLAKLTGNTTIFTDSTYQFSSIMIAAFYSDGIRLFFLDDNPFRAGGGAHHTTSTFFIIHNRNTILY